MRNYCVIGDPIEHSLSPAIYSFLFSRYGMSDCSYGREQVDVPGLPGFISGIRSNEIRGFNVTMPLKKSILPFLSWIGPDADHGVNTVVVTEEGLKGWSTDASGFRKSLALHGKKYDNANVVFIGCGGAAQALIRDALKNNARSVVVLNRTPSKARELASDPRMTVGPLEDLSSHMPECDILVNATPLGMRGVSQNFEDLSFFSRLPREALAADLIYDPPETVFLREANRTGHETMNGLWMLIWQAFFAFEHFTGTFPNMEDFLALRAELERK